MNSRYESFDEYGLRHWPDQLLRLKRWEEVARILTDLEFMEAKCNAGMAYGLANDYTVAVDTFPDMQRNTTPYTSLKILGQVIRLSAYILNDRPSELLGQLLGRIPSSPSSAVQAVLQQAKSRKAGTWLRPITNSLTVDTPLLDTLDTESNSIWDCAISPNGHRAVAGTYNNTLTVWDLQTRKLINTIETEDIYSFAVAWDGLKSVTGGRDGIVRVLDLETGRLLNSFVGRGNPEKVALNINRVDISNDGKVAISSCMDGEAKLYDLMAGRVRHSLPEKFYHAVMLSKDGQRAFGDEPDSEIGMWDTETGCLLQKFGVDPNFKTSSIDFNPNFYNCTAIVITPDNCRLAATFKSHALVVWDIESAQIVCVNQTYIREPCGLAITTSGRRIITGSFEGKIQVWDGETGNEWRSFDAHTERIVAVKALNEQLVLSASEDGTFKLWDIEWHS